MNNHLKSLVLLLSLYSVNILAEEIKVNIVNKGVEQWTKQEMEVIEKAASIAFKRLASYKTAVCAYRYTTKPYIKNKLGKRVKLTKDQLRMKWEKQIAVINKSRRVSIIISKEALAKKILGKAQLNIASTNRENYTLQGLEITLDKLKIEKQLASEKNFDATAIWVNTIAHEVAHNFGYSHLTGSSWKNDYEGFFPTELGYCAMNDGSHGSYKVF